MRCVAPCSLLRCVCHCQSPPLQVRALELREAQLLRSLRALTRSPASHANRSVLATLANPASDEIGAEERDAVVARAELAAAGALAAHEAACAALMRSPCMPRPVEEKLSTSEMRGCEHSAGGPSSRSSSSGPSPAAGRALASASTKSITSLYALPALNSTLVKSLYSLAAAPACPTPPKQSLTPQAQAQAQAQTLTPSQTPQRTPPLMQSPKQAPPPAPQPQTPPQMPPTPHCSPPPRPASTATVAPLRLAVTGVAAANATTAAEIGVGSCWALQGVLVMPPLPLTAAPHPTCLYPPILSPGTTASIAVNAACGACAAASAAAANAAAAASAANTARTARSVRSARGLFPTPGISARFPTYSARKYSARKQQLTARGTTPSTGRPVDTPSREGYVPIAAVTTARDAAKSARQAAGSYRQAAVSARLIAQAN